MLTMLCNPFTDDLSRQTCPLPGCPGHLRRERVAGAEGEQLRCTDPGCRFAVKLAECPEGAAAGRALLQACTRAAARPGRPAPSHQAAAPFPKG